MASVVNHEPVSGVLLILSLEFPISNLTSHQTEKLERSFSFPRNLIGHGGVTPIFRIAYYLLHTTYAFLLSWFRAHCDPAVERLPSLDCSAYVAKISLRDNITGHPNILFTQDRSQIHNL